MKSLLMCLSCCSLETVSSVWAQPLHLVSLIPNVVQTQRCLGNVEKVEQETAVLFIRPLSLDFTLPGRGRVDLQSRHLALELTAIHGTAPGAFDHKVGGFILGDKVL